MVQTAWEVVGSYGLTDNVLDKIAEKTGISILEVQEVIPDQTSLILMLMADVFSHIRTSPASGLSDQDYLFDMLMQGFDSAETHKFSIKKIWSSIAWKPWVLLPLIPAIQKKLHEMVVELSSSSSFFKKMVSEIGLQVVFLNVFFIWMEDETLDLSKTMACLDTSLKQYFEINQYVR